MTGRMVSMLIPVIATCIVATNAFADDESLAKPNEGAARDHLAAGNKLYRVREFEKAAEEYKAGSVIEAAPVFDYNLGQCYRLLGRYDEALWHYDRFLKHAHPGQQLLAAVNGFVAQMRSELDKKAMTQQPRDAEPTETSTSAHDAAKPTSSGDAAIRPTSMVIVERADPWYADTPGWVVAGGGTVAIGVGAYLFLNASSLRDQANANPDQLRRRSQQDSAKTRYTIGTTVGIAGVGLVVAGIIKLAIHSDERVSRPETTSFDLTVTGSGLALAGQF